MHQLNDDSPESDIEQDALNTGRIASYIADSIHAQRRDVSLVYGVFGPWGSGKSTLLDYIETCLLKLFAEEVRRKRFRIIRFNPWWFADGADLTKTFLKTISSELSPLDKALAKFDEGMERLVDAAKGLLASELFLSTGEIHNALDRASRAQLFDPDRKRPRIQALEEFLVHGIKYAFPAERGPLTRGIPTAYAAPPLNDIISAEDGDHPPVWPDPEGSTRGYKLEPLYPSVPKAAKLDKTLYELLALVDAIRDGRARERNLAVEHLHKHLRKKNAAA